MKHEIEAKIKVDSLAPYETLLKSLGAGGGSPAYEVDIYFACRGNPALGKDSALRLRKCIRSDGEKYILTYKGPRSDSPFKSRPEAQTELADYQSAQAILTAIGMTPSLTVEKQRTVWTLGGCEVCLDNVPPLGQFIEVEGPDEAAIDAVLAKLKLDGQKHIAQGYAKMMARLLKKQHSSCTDAP